MTDYDLRSLPSDIVSMPLTEGAEDVGGLLKAVFVAGDSTGKVAQAMLTGTGLQVVTSPAAVGKLVKRATIPTSKVGARYSLRGKKVQPLETAHALRRGGLTISTDGWTDDEVKAAAASLRKVGYDTALVSIGPAPKGLEAAFGANVTVVKGSQTIPSPVFSTITAPALRKLGQKILRAPLANKIGRAWVAARQLEAPAEKDIPKKAFRNPKSMLTKKVLTAEQVAKKTPAKWMLPATPLGPSVNEAADGGIAKVPDLKTKRRLGVYDDAEVFEVDGEEVRQYITDLIGGANGYAYPGLVPKDEIWVEKMPTAFDTAAIAVHEMVEFTRMRYAKEKYQAAHKGANDAEAIVRTICGSEVKESIMNYSRTCILETAGALAA